MAQVQDPKTDGATDEVEMNSSEQNGGSSGGVIAPSTFVFGQNMESRVVKRPADEQLDPETAEKEEEKTEEPGEFPKASANVMAQRPLIAPGSSFKDKAAEGEGSERPSFKLAPATFGATKTTRTDESVTSAAMTTQASTTTKTVVKPAILATPQEWQPTFGSVAKASATPFKLKESALQAASDNVNGKGQNKDESKGASSTSESMDDVTTSPSKDDEANKTTSEKTDSKPSLAEGTSTDKTRNNYFLKLNDGNDGRNVGFGVFGTFTDSQIGTVTFGKPEKEQNGSTAENYFLQFANNGSEQGSLPTSSEGTTPITSPGQKSAGSPTSNLSLSGSGSAFVFGQHMNERVTSVVKEGKGELETAAEFVFGQNLGDRIKSEEGEESGSGDQTMFSPDTSGKTLAENANAYAEAKESSRVKFEQVPKLTGEEEEENVLQVQCKLYIFDVTKRSWQERGRGMLRLNDKRQSTPDAAIQSRLVMRTQGSLRVILNTKLWSSMILEKASSKSLRISALDSETKTPRVFLISSTPKDAEQMYRAIEYRIQELKHEEQLKADNDTTQDTASSTNQEEDEDEESNQESHSRTDNKEQVEESIDKDSPSPTTSGALQSTDTKDSQNTQDKAEDTTEKEAT